MEAESKSQWYAQLSLGMLKLARYHTAGTAATQTENALAWGQRVEAMGVLQQHISVLLHTADVSAEQRHSAQVVRTQLLSGTDSAALTMALQVLQESWKGSTALDNAKVEQALAVLAASTSH